MFLKHDANILPDHKDENHKIELLEVKQVSFVQNYKLLLLQETYAIKKYIDKYLRESFIRPSSLVAVASVLLVRKPRSGLRFYVDYKIFNVITVKNKYSILLINKILGKLLNARHFTKLNIIYAFDRICIKKSQEWLIVFNTKYDQFEYLVLPFGLYNALRMF